MQKLGPYYDINGYQGNNQQILKEFEKVISKEVGCVDISNLTVDMCKNVPWQTFTFINNLECYKIPVGLYEDIALLTSLRKIIFSTSVKVKGVNHLTSLTKLHSISLMEIDQNLFDEIYKALPQINNFRLGTLRGAGIIDSLYKFTALKSLSFVSCNFPSLSLSGLSKCAHLQCLDISRSRNIASSSLEHLVKVPRLEVLIAQEVCVDIKKSPGNLFKVAGQLTNLKILDLGRNFICTENDLLNLVTLTGLKCLNLTFNKKMHAGGISKLTTLQSLEKLNIYGIEHEEDSVKGLIKSLACLTRLDSLIVDDFEVNYSGYSEYKDLIAPMLVRNRSLWKLVVNALPRLINLGHLKSDIISTYFSESIRMKIEEQQQMEHSSKN